MNVDFHAVKAIIFDMDGVLFLSNDCHEVAWRETLASIGILNFSYASIAGMRTDDALQKILSLNGKRATQDHIKQLVHHKRKRVLGFLEKEGKVAEGSHGLIARLRRKYRLALASSASPQTVELFLRKSEYEDAFEFVLDGSLVEKAKPAPDIYLLALQNLRLRADECVVVEDSMSGIQAALSAQIPVIALSKSGRKEQFVDLKPTMVISNITDLEPLLAQ